MLFRSILRDPSRRLRTLINKTPASPIPPEAAELFPRVATLTQEVDDLLARHVAATTPLAKAVLAAPLKKITMELGALLLGVESWHYDLKTRLSALDQAWPSHDSESLSNLAASFSYATRWESQLRERKLALDCL